MEILVLAKVRKVQKSKADFEHEGVEYRFVNRKMDKVTDDFHSHIDCIDNDYTDKPAPYFARVYFGWLDQNQYNFDDDHIEHDTEILFAKKGYSGEISESTIIVPDDTDMYRLADAYEEDNLCDLWLALCNILGEKEMENAGVCTTGNKLYYSKDEILQIQEKCKWVNDFLERISNEIL